MDKKLLQPLQYKSSNSYFSKHRLRLQKSQIKPSPSNNSLDRSGIDSSMSHNESKFKEPNEDFSKIRIQENLSEEQNLYQEYKEMESEYSKQLQKTKKQIQKVKVNIDRQRKKIKQIEGILSEKRKKLASLKQALDNSARTSLQTQPEDHAERTAILEEELAEKKANNAKQLTQLINRKQIAEKQNQNLKNTMGQLQQQLSQLKGYEEDEYNRKLTELVQSELNLKQEVEQMRVENTRLQESIAQFSQPAQLQQETHRKYLQIYEKMYMSKQIAIAEHVIKLKDEEIKKLQLLENKKQSIKQKQNEIILRTERGKQLELKIQKLTADVVQKSNVLMTLYSQKNQKRNK